MSWYKEQSIRFWDDLHSDLDPEILFLLRVFAICKIAVHCYYALGVSTIMPTILVKSLILISCTSLTLRTKTYSLAEV